jgi:hypothetical protein
VRARSTGRDSQSRSAPSLITAPGVCVCVCVCVRERERERERERGEREREERERERREREREVHSKRYSRGGKNRPVQSPMTAPDMCVCIVCVCVCVCARGPERERETNIQIRLAYRLPDLSVPPPPTHTHTRNKHNTWRCSPFSGPYSGTLSKKKNTIPGGVRPFLAHTVGRCPHTLCRPDLYIYT